MMHIMILFLLTMVLSPTYYTYIGYYKNTSSFDFANLEAIVTGSTYNDATFSTLYTKYSADNTRILMGYKKTSSTLMISAAILMLNSMFLGGNVEASTSNNNLTYYYKIGKCIGASKYSIDLNTTTPYLDDSGYYSMFSWSISDTTRGVCKYCTDYYPTTNTKVLYIFKCKTYSSTGVCTACISGYGLDSNKICQKCHASCLKCTGIGAEDCVDNQCSTGYANLLLATENNGAINSYKCALKTCTAPRCIYCLSTSFTDCIKCDAGFNFYSKSSPPDSCAQCPIVCKTCLAPVTPIASSVCDVCYDGYYKSGTTCIKCSEACNICTGGGASSCTSCSGNFTKTTTGFTSYCTRNNACPLGCSICAGALASDCLQSLDGYFLSSNTVPTQCSPCALPCKTCSSTNTTCQSCVDGYYKSSNLCLACQTNCKKCTSNSYSCVAADCNTANGYNYDNALNLCVKTSSCSLGCSVCVGPQENECITCLPTYYRFSGTDRYLCKICLDPCEECSASNVCTKCKAGYFISGTSCSQCHQSCDTCLGNSLNCTLCSSNYNSTVIGSYKCTISTGCSVGCDNCIGFEELDCIDCTLTYYPSGAFPNSCTRCIYPCSTCDALSATRCLTCADGYYPSAGSCLSCHPSCLTCTSNTAASCSTCNSTAGSGYSSAHVIGSFKCTRNTLCSLGCSYCVGPLASDCLECQDGFALSSNTLPTTCGKCTNLCEKCDSISSSNCTECIDGYYLDNKQCIACDYTCETCGSAGPSNCILCNTDLLFAITNPALNGYKCTRASPCPIGCLKCVGLNPENCLICDTGYSFRAAIPSACIPCDFPCDTCPDNPTANSPCTTCHVGYYLAGAANNVCNQCHESCAECTSSDPGDCSTCVASFIHQAAGEFSCVSTTICTQGCAKCISKEEEDCIECAEGYAFTLSATLPNTCIKCPPQCISCTSADSTHCSSCKAGYYHSGSTCLECHAACSTCSGPTAGECNLCSTGYASVEVNPPKLCKRSDKCSIGCNKCIGSGNNDCVECLPTYAINGAIPNSCSKCPYPCNECSSQAVCTTCLDHYYFDAGSCLICHNSCDNCDGPLATNCDGCATSYLENTTYSDYCFIETNCGSHCQICTSNLNNECLKCIDGYYIPSLLSTCSSCTPPCLKCDRISTNCTECTSGYYLDSGNACALCHLSCFDCVGSDPEDCVNCATGFTKYGHFCVRRSSQVGCKYEIGMGANSCVECYSEYYIIAAAPSSCSPCTSPCSSCEDSTTDSCLSCEPHYYLETTGPSECLICHDSCGNCNSSSPTDCSTCAIGYAKRVVNSSVCSHAIDCVENCKYCYENTIEACIECSTDFNFDGKHNCRNKRCALNCELCNDKTYGGCLSCYALFSFNTEHMCILTTNCGVNCNECIMENADNKCTRCENGYALYQSLDISYCVTSVCALNCKYCLNSTVEGCIECDSVNGFVFFSEVDKRCVTEISCGANCAKCYEKNDNSKCVSCVDDFNLYNNLLVSYCAHTEPCITNCEYCLNNTFSGCLECKPSYELFNGKWCALSALSSSCGINCAKCIIENDNTKCVECVFGFSLYKSMDPSYCASNDCISGMHCSYCLSNDTNNCIECQNPFRFISDLDHTCVIENCYTNCKYCIASSFFDCIECINSSYALLSSAPSICEYTYSSCHSNCINCLSTEPDSCITCKGGYNLYNNLFPSYCVTQLNCEELCKYCLDDGQCIECKGNGYLESGKCVITCEEGYKFYTTSPYCREICGDGLMMGEFECDDGNTIDGDGCDKECKKEPNAICDTSSSTGSCYLPGYNIAYVEGMYKVNLKFNFPVDNIEQYLSNLKAGIRRADGSLADVKVSSAKVLNDSTIELELAMDEVETTTSDSLVVELPGYPKYSDGDSYLNMSKLSSAALPNVQTKESGITKGLLYAAFSIGIISLVCSVFTKQPDHQFWDIIYSAQLLSLGVIINFRKIPPLMYGIFRTCGMAMISFIPKFLINLLSLDAVFESKVSKDNISKHSFILSTNFINNTAPLLLILVILGLFYMIIRLLMRTTKFKENPTLITIRSKFEYLAFLKYLKFTELPILIAGVYMLRECKQIITSESIANYAGFGVGVLFMALYIVWIISFSIFVCKSKNRFTESEFKTKFGEIYTRYQLLGKPIITNILVTLRKYVCACIILMPTLPFLQSMAIIVARLGIILWYLIVRPQHSRIQFILSLTSEVSLLLGQIVYSLLQSTQIMVYHINVVDKIACAFTIIGIYSIVVEAVIESVINWKKYLASKTPTKEIPIEDIKNLRSLNDSAITLNKENSFVNDKSIDMHFNETKTGRFRKVKL